MSSKAKLTSKGQITLPREVRQRLGLKQGDFVSFTIENGHTVLKPVRVDNPFEQYEGALGSFDTQQEINTWIGDLRDDD